MFTMKMNLVLAILLLSLVTVVGLLHGHSFLTSLFFGVVSGIGALVAIIRS